MRTLILTLPPDGIDATTRLAYVRSADGLTVTDQDTVTLALLPTDADEVVAVVPAHLLSWHRVSLPAGSVPRGLRGERAMTRLRSILDGLLEDDLLDDPPEMHLALAPQAGPGAPVWVGACNRAWLSTALTALAQAGHPVRRVVPELTPQALAGSVLIAGDPDAPWVAGLLRGNDDDGEAAGVLVCPLNTAALARLDAPARAQDATELPTLLAEPAVAAQAEQLCQRPAVLQQRAERLLLAAQSDWNLAQFDLAHLGHNQRWARARMAAQSFVSAPAWRAARLALALVLVVNLVGLNAFALREKALLAGQREAVRAVLSETFPRIPVIVDAPLQMAREVALLQRNSGATARTDLEPMLDALAASSPVLPAINSIDYQANQLRLGGAALGDTEGIAARLAAHGLQASAQDGHWLMTGVQP